MPLRTHPVWEGSEKFYLVKVFQKPRSTQEFCGIDVATSPPRDSLCSAIGLLWAVRTPHIISGMRCGSALFSSKVPRVRGPRVLWSQMSVRNVVVDLLPVLSISHCPQVPFQ